MALTTVRITDGICPVFSSGGSRRAHNLHFSHLKSTRRLTSVAAPGRRRYRAKVTATVNPYSNTEAARPEERKSLRDFLSEAENFYTSEGGDGGPPRWFSPLQCSSHAAGSPLLLYIPGMDGTGLGLIRQHRRLGEIFDVWCLHFPAMDRTPARDIVKLIERTVRSEYYRVPNRPIYIVGESVGACLALDVAASNPDIDIVLILANPVTSLNNFMLQPLSSLLETLPDEVPSLIEENFGFKEGYPFSAMFESMLNETVAQMGGGILGDIIAASANLPSLIRIFPKDTLLWKLQLLKSASASAKSHMYTVKAQTLILLSGRDQWLRNNGDIERLRFALPKCEVREFYNNGQFLFLEDGVDLATIIKISYYYRRGKILDYISDYTLPTPYELKEFEQSQRLLTAATAPVFLSTLDDGTVVRSLEGIPSEGPVLYVGNHMLFGLELRPAAIHFLKERNILLRGLAHPVMFTKKIGSKLPDMQMFDSARIIGAVPVSNMNFYKLLRSKAHVVLYPGGVREALHRKGEEYKLFWPEHSEFVRIASKFGARIIPFGAVGEDDLCQMVLDYNDQMKIPFLKNLIEEITHDTIKLRNDEEGELRNQDLHMPGFIPKIPGRYYVYFGKPIETKGREKELHDKEKAHEVYLEVKSEVERCMTYLKTKRETDPYRNILPRLLYYLSHGFSSEVPTFDLPNH
ncbi:acyltransferase-like protein At3g26840, chloroplastic isoform X1 [Brassica rapa]|uniref:acyltransferase-like protein At3g26840, chloroplastic isoform X1 n=1 Tax=Brassica campestris TaxID=3711 RepID=UPI00142D5A06|nr:acyltransferase-like protein At3g26840, chloroplastic isoform X1 [Brassica rapa]